MTDADLESADATKLASLRELLPATGAGIYLATAELGPLPSETAAAMRDADDWELRVGRATEGRAEDFEQRVEEARAVLAALLVADPSEIVLTTGIDAALVLAERIGGPGAAVLDASLTVGAERVEAAASGADLIAFACDKWLLGPEQTTALWINPRLAAAALGVAPSSGLARTAVLGLARSVGWLEMYVQLDWIYERTRMLAERLAAALAVTGVEVERTAPAVIDFSLTEWPMDEALSELRRRVFTIIESTPDGAAIRASVAWFNTAEEIDRFASAVRELAAHTPESLPRRPPLIVR